MLGDAITEVPGIFETPAVAPRKSSGALSPTQIDTYLLCHRKWGWSKLAGIPSPQAPSAALGEKVHGVLEAWLLSATPPDQMTREGAIAMQGLQFLPAPGMPGMVVENKFDFEYRGVRFTGRKDLEYDRGDRRVVHDHKTTSGFRWAKTRDDLRKDPQGVIYAFESFRRIDVAEIDLNWLYLLTSASPRAKMVELTVLREDVTDEMNRLTDVGVEMTALVRANAETPLDVLGLEYNKSACEAFGGCPHRERCNLSANQRFASFMQQAERKGLMSTATDRLLASINAKKQLEGAPQVAPSAPKVGLAEQLTGAPPVAVNPPPYQAPVAAAAPTPAAAASPPPGTPAAVAKRLAGLGLGVEAIGEALKAQFPDLTTDDIVIILATPAPAPAPAPAPVPAPVAAPASAPVPVPAPVAASAPAPAPEAPKAKAGPGRGKKTATAVPDLGTVGEFVLIVDGAITKGPGSTTLGEFLAPVHAQLRAELDVKHYKLVDYGKGTGALIEAVRQRLEQAPFSGVLLLDSTTPEGSDLLNLLSEFATMVVRGIR